MRKSSYMFTNKNHPPRGIVSSVLGCMDLVSLILVTLLSFQAKGNATARHAAVTMLALLFSVIGLVFGVLARMEKDKFYLFPNIGIAINLLVIACVTGMLVLGAS
ncbi:MAG: hypothetical protein J6P60_02690 [Lachnospiraceae bacterium]|nr:hypothetical protein [Lachnospiraceae bacterium]